MVLFCKSLSPFHLRMLYDKFGWNWPNVSAEEDFYISSMYFFCFVIISPLKKGGGGAFIWTILHPHHPRMLCAKFSWNWSNGTAEEDFKISSMYFCYFVIFSPWKRAGPSFEQIWILFTQKFFVPSLIEIGLMFLEKKILKFHQCIFAIIIS